MKNKILCDTIQDFLKNGRSSETFVSELLENMCGGTCENATQEEDRIKHIDIWWNSPKKGRLGIDVKGLKKNHRNDNYFDDSIHWIEIIGVTGHRGWIYGEMDYIAFLTRNKVLFVKPNDLYGKLLLNIAGKPLVDKCPNEFYIPYRRHGRKDIVVKVPTTDLAEIAQFILEYGLEK
jgi:hypothetical protein